MKKKILPIVAIVGTGALIAGCSSNMSVKKENFINNINSFQEDLYEYTSVNEKNLTTTALNKYKLSILSEDVQDHVQENLNNEENVDTTQSNNTILNEESQKNLEIENRPLQAEQENEENLDTNIEQISTLYSLSNDIEDSCEDFCELKKDLSSAIVETQNLINKIQNKEVTLTNEQRMFITEQSAQLKNLGRQLSNITTELSFHLSDLSQIMSTSADDIDSLNLKYLVVLDNLINGNEMLQSSLSSLNLINQMFNMKSTLPPNNQGRILYGFKHNDNPAVIKDYYIDENGKIIENKDDVNKQENAEQVNNDETINNQSSKSNIDTYQNNNLNTNIDTYVNRNVPRNIDSFFNTALLDNEFMYGNGGYGPGMYGAMNPYMQNYANYANNANYGANQNNNTQYNEGTASNQNNKNNTKKEKKRIQLKKNIDTFKDENEPDIKTKLGNIKSAITGFFGKFKKSDLDDKIGNPVYRENLNSEN